MTVPCQPRLSFRVLALGLGLVPATGVMAAGGWNCSRSPVTQEWTCGGPNEAARTGATRPSEQPETALDAGTPRSRPAGKAVGERGAEASEMLANPEDDAPEFPPDVPAELPPARPERAATAPADRGPPQPGWHCQPAPVESDAEEQSWSCTQVEAPVVAGGDAEEEGTSFTGQDEARFQHMLRAFPVDPWKNACSGLLRPPPLKAFQLTPAEEVARTRAPTVIDANYFEMLGGEMIESSGRAEITRADQKITGDFLSRNMVSNTVNAHGNVFYQEKGMALAGDAAFLRANTDQGTFRNAQFLFPAVPGRGTARMAFMDSRTLSRYETVTYSTCPPGNDDWLLHAANVKVNKESGLGSAQNAWMEFKGVPFFYTPYISFPVDDRRMSGFLSPSFGTSTVSGFSLQAPYYFNLAPNYDYTVTPRYLWDRGFQLKNEFRYLTESTRGRLYGDIVPHDDQTGTTRGQAGLLNDTRFTERLTSRVNANYVSDALYLNQLGSQLGLVDRSNIYSYGYLMYAGDGYSLRSQIDYFQTIDPTIIDNNGQPFFHLPQLAFNYSRNLMDSGLFMDSPIVMDSFQTAATNKTTGQRLKFRPRLYYPLTSSAGYVIPSVAVQYNQYWLQNPEKWAAANQTETDSTASYVIPVVSLDSGLFFDNEFDWADTAWVQTLEPRIFYDYIPYHGQSNIPVFDSSTYDFTYYQMFRENRFTGSDRVGDTNQFTVSLTSRLRDEGLGFERFRGSLGTVFYFADRLVTLNNAGYDPAYAPGVQPSQLQGTSNLIGDVGVGVTEDWSLHTGGQWNPDDNQIQRGIVALQYNNGQNHLLNLAYRYRVDQYTLNCVKDNPYNGCLNLTDVSLRLPVYAGWFFIGRWQYSILNQLTLESFAGVERETCCWRFALVVRNYINNYIVATDTPQSNFGFFFQFEFKGLAKSGNDVDQFLARSVSGYRYKDSY